MSSIRTPLTVSPHEYFGDITGRPLDYGTIYFGEPDKDPEFYPIDVYSDEALTQPIPQPIRTKGGFINVNGDIIEIYGRPAIYSVKVLDQYGRKIFYKGKAMRNNVNDDIIAEIDAAIQQSKDDGVEYAKKAVREAIDDTVTDGSPIADTMIAVDGSLSQRAINKGLESIADLSTIKNPKDGLRVYVKSYHAGTNIGGGFFVWDSSVDKNLADGGSLIDTTTVAGLTPNTTLAFLNTQGSGVGKGLWRREVVNGSMVYPENFGGVYNDPTVVGLEKVINYCLKLPTKSVYLNSGNWYLDSCIRMPSYSTLEGSGIHSTYIYASDRFSKTVHDHLVTSEFFQRDPHTNYTYGYTVKDFTVDMRAREREHFINTQSCNVYITVAEDVLVENVRSRNANLHCFDATSSYYFSYEGESKNIKFVNCLAEDPYWDDGFTSHYSSSISWINCACTYDNDTFSIQDTQSGFEVDDGSYDCHLINCYSEGYRTGFQVKGHGGQIAARNVLLQSCTAHRSGISFSFAGNGAESLPNGAKSSSNITMRNCTVSDTFPEIAEAVGSYIIRSSQVMNLIVDGLQVRDYKAATIWLYGHESNGVILRNIVFETASEKTYTTYKDALIEWIPSVRNGGAGLVIDNVISLVPQPIGMVFIDNASYRSPVSIRGLTSDSTNPLSSMIIVPNSFMEGVKLDNINGTGWRSLVNSTANQVSYTDKNAVTPSIASYFFSNGVYLTLVGTLEGSPEGVIGAYGGTRYINKNKVEYVKVGGFSSLPTDGWKQVAFLSDIPAS